MTLVQQIKTKQPAIHPARDIVAGLIVALVSIPIAMGYSQIAGLPAVYGLYGSLLPILVFGLISSSPQFIVGVDAMPAVMVGSLLAQFGIAAESDAAMALVPLVSLFTAVWFLIFYFMKAGRVVKYISTPVMGGFISGVGLTIIFMQIPKLFGGSAGTGELYALLIHIKDELPSFNLVSAILGFGTFALILLFKKKLPKIPMTIVMMFVGAALQAILHLERFGVKMLPEVASGLPKFIFPDFSYVGKCGRALVMESLSIATVIMAQTLLASGSYAMKNDYKLDNGRELLAYGAMNLASAATGGCPINGSVSRSAIAASFKGHSQIMSVSAFVSMLAILLFGTPLLKYLPVPVLTGIVLTALWGILDFSMFRKLWKTSKNEWFVFMIAFVGVLIFGTVNGVIIGVVLSFFDVAISSVAPAATFEGCIPGQKNFFVLDRNKKAQPIKGAVIYRFSGNLFFANIDRFQSDIENSIKDDTQVVVVDARGIGSVDITAAERLLAMNANFRKKDIQFYIAEHDGSLNDELRKLGAEDLLKHGCVRRTITLAMADAGFIKPYDLEEGNGENDSDLAEYIDMDEVQMTEFEWLFGESAANMIEEIAKEEAVVISEENDADENVSKQDKFGHWHTMSPLDEEVFLDHLEMHYDNLLKEGRISELDIERLITRAEARRAVIEKKLDEINPEIYEKIKSRYEAHIDNLKTRNPQAYKHIKEIVDHVKDSLPPT